MAVIYCLYEINYLQKNSFFINIIQYMKILNWSAGRAGMAGRSLAEIICVTIGGIGIPGLQQEQGQRNNEKIGGKYVLHNSLSRFFRGLSLIE